MDEEADEGDWLWDWAVWKEEPEVETILVRWESAIGEVVRGMASVVIGLQAVLLKIHQGCG